MMPAWSLSTGRGSGLRSTLRRRAILARLAVAGALSFLHGPLLDARLAGQVAFDVVLALGAGDVRRCQLDSCRVHMPTPSRAATCVAGVAALRGCAVLP